MNDEHPEIPTGHYCHGSLEVISKDDGKPVLKTHQTCPHWQKTENGARCNLLNREDHTYCWLHLVWDQVKECGIKVHEPGYVPPKSRLRDEPGWAEQEHVCECGKTNRIMVRERGNAERNS
jgi:hypothetical protein